MSKNNVVNIEVRAPRTFPTRDAGAAAIAMMCESMGHKRVMELVADHWNVTDPDAARAIGPRVRDFGHIFKKKDGQEDTFDYLTHRPEALHQIEDALSPANTAKILKRRISRHLAGMGRTVGPRSPRWVTIDAWLEEFRVARKDCDGVLNFPIIIGSDRNRMLCRMVATTLGIDLERFKRLECGGMTFPQWLGSFKVMEG